MDKDIDFFRRAYKQQKRLEEIVNARPLQRPNVKKWQVTAMFVILPFLLFAAIFFLILADVNVRGKVGLAVCFFVVIWEGYVRLCLILLVKCYQRYASEKTRRRCKCIPSCSQYALLALKTCFPLLVALLKIRKRLYRTCNGEEYKVDYPKKKASKKYYENI